MTDIDPAASAAGRALRKVHESRPAVFHKCPHCGLDFRAKDVRWHKARYDQNPSIISRVRAELARE